MILFVVSDAGPAKYLAYVISAFGESKYKCIASNISAKVLDHFSVKYFIGDEGVDFNNFNLIVTGSRFEPCIDDKWVSIGLQNNIRTISIIEHWSLYRKRFEVNGKYIYPDMIFVNDYQAKVEAAVDGIPEDKLHIVGNPVLENTQKYEYSANDELKWRNSLGIDRERKVITFISENFRADFPRNSPEYEGFDEFEVLNDIYAALCTESVLLIKLHPSEDFNKYDFLTKNLNIIIILETDINKLIEFSNKLIGMGSMLLIEASIIKNNVYSYRPNETIEFIGNKNGMVKKIHSKAELKRELSNYESEDFSVTNNTFLGSTKNIVNLIKNLL